MHNANTNSVSKLLVEGDSAFESIKLQGMLSEYSTIYSQIYGYAPVVKHFKTPVELEPVLIRLRQHHALVTPDLNRLRGNTI